MNKKLPLTDTEKSIQELYSENPNLVTIQKAAKALKVSKDTLRRWEAKGKISSIRTTSGYRLYDLKTLSKAAKTKSTPESPKENVTTKRIIPAFTSQTPLIPEVKTAEHSFYQFANLNPEIVKIPSNQPVSLAPSEPVKKYFSRNIVTEPVKNFSKFRIYTLAAVLVVLLSTAAMAATSHKLAFIKDLAPVKFLSALYQSTPKELRPSQEVALSTSKPEVLAASSIAKEGKFLQLSLDTNIVGNLAVEGEGVFTENITAPNVIYSLVAGNNISITGDPQSPTISSTVTLNDATNTTKGIASFSSTFFTVTAGAVSIADSSITDTQIKDGTITNSDLANTSITINAGSGLSGGGTVSLGGSITLSATGGGGSVSGVSTITGTADQIIASASTGDITLSLPQSIATTSSPEFANLTLSDLDANGVVFTTGAGLLDTVTTVSTGECLLSNGAGAPTWGSCFSGSTSFTLAGDSGPNQSISSGDTLTINGDSNIATTGVDTDHFSVTLASALTGITSIDTIAVSSTALTFAGAGSISSTTTAAITIDSGTTGDVNLGTGNNAKTINLGTGTAGNTINIGTNNTVADAINIGSALDTTTLAGAFTLSALTTNGGVLYTNGSGAVGQTAAGSLGYVLTSNGGGAPTWTDPGSLTVRWNTIDDPNGNQTLAMADYTTTWNWDTADTETAFSATANALTSGTLFNLSSTSTAGTGSGNSYLLDLSRSGTNSNASHTAYGVRSQVTNTGSTSTNIAGYFSASGATTNYAINAPSGYMYLGGGVGIGTDAPTQTSKVAIVTTGAASALDITNNNTGTTAYGVNITKAGAATTGIGLYVSSSGATNNYSAIFASGRVGIGDTTPDSLLDIEGSITGTPSSTGAWLNYTGSTFTDSATSGSGTATTFAANAFGQTTLAATNSNVTTTNAATLYIANAPTAGSNQTITAPLSLLVDNGNARFDGHVGIGGGFNNIAVSSTQVLGISEAYSGSSQFTHLNVYGAVAPSSSYGVAGYAAYINADLHSSATAGVTGSLTSGYFKTSNGNTTQSLATAYGVQIASATTAGGAITTNYGLFINSQTAGTSDYGIRIDAADTQTLWVGGGADGTTSAAGIAFGSSRDTNLYRSAADTLKTDDAFNVNGNLNISSAGAITAATGITSSGTITFSGLSADSGVYTTTGGQLTTTPPSSGTLGYWSRSGTTLSPANSGDAITTSGNISTTGSGTGTFAGLLTATSGLTLGSSSDITFGNAETIDNDTNGILNFAVDSTSALKIGSTGITSIGNVAHSLVNSGGSLALDSNSTATLLIGTSTNAKSIFVGNNTGSTNLNLNSGTGAMTFKGYNATGNTTSSAFVFDGAGVSTGTGIYITSTATSGKTVDINATQTSGTIFNLAYGSAKTLSGSLTGLYVDLNSGNVDATNQNLTGVNFKIPTVTDTHTTGTKTLTGMLVNFGSGAGINQNGAGGTLEYIAGDFYMPALTQTAGTLNAYGTRITTPATITTGGTAYGSYISATGVGAGSLSGLGISSITGGSGTEYALNVGTGWDAVLRVGSTTVINGSGVTTAVGGGTGQSSYAVGDLLYADSTTTLAKRNIGNEDEVLTVVGGVPTWTTISGASCSNCLVDDPTTDQIISPTGQSTTGLAVRQTSTASPTDDIFQVTDSTGASKYFWVDKDGNVSTAGTSSQTLTLTPLSDTTALTLVGTNVTSQSLQYINAKNQSATSGILNMAYGAAETLTGSVIGIRTDLSTNVTATNQSVTGYQITLPSATNTSGTQAYKGLAISGGSINENGGTATTFTGVDVTIPALTQTSGTLTAYGTNITTPSSITTAGTAYGVNVAASGVGAGTLYGLNISDITAGAGTEVGAQIGSGWDTNLLFNDTSTRVAVANGGTITILDSAGNSLCTITDNGSAGDLSCSGSISGSGSVGFWSRSGSTLSTTNASDNVTVDGTLTANGTFDANGQFDLGDGGDAGTISATTLDIDATGALQINSSGGAISIGNDAVAQNINIGTGAAARTITTGNSTGATALNFTSGTGSQTFSSSVATTSTTSSAFVFNANSLTSGTGAYINSTSLTTGKLFQLSTGAANTLTSGTLGDIRTTSTALTGTTGTGSLLNLDWSPGSSTTATGDLFALNIGSNGSTTGNLFNILDSGSSIFSISENQVTTSLPANFTSPGDVSIAYDLSFTNPTASYIKSYAGLTIQPGDPFGSSNLTISPYNEGSVYIPSNVATAYGLDVDANLLSTGRAVDISSSSTAGGASGSSYLLYLDRSGANSNATHTAYGLYSSVANTGTTNVNIGVFSQASGAITNYGVQTGAITSAASGTNYQLNLGAITGASSATSASINTGAISGAGTSSSGITLGANSSTATTNYGLNIGAISGAGTTNYGINIAGVSGASTNYAIYVGSGNVNIQGLTASSAVYTDGSKNLTSTAPSSGTIGYWSRTGTTLSPANSGDSVLLDNNTAFQMKDTGGTTRSLVSINSSDMQTFGVGAYNATYNGYRVDITSALPLGQGVDSAFDIKSSSDLGSSDELIQFGDSAGDFMTILGGGNVGIGDTSPAALFTVGSSDAFQINSSGNIANIGGAAHTIANSSGALGIDSATTGAINIGTGANAKTITIGNSTGATALAFNSGTGSQTFTSQVVSGTTTSSAFVFDATSLTTGTGSYFTSDSITQGKLVQIATTGNTLTSGTLADIRTTSTALTGTTGTGSLLNLDWSPGSSTTATGDLFALNIGSNGSTTGNLFNILDSGTSIFSISESAMTTSLPSNFTAAGDVTVAYDLNFTNPTASYIKSQAPLAVVAGETFGSSNLTLGTYNQGTIVLSTNNTTSTAVDLTNTTLTTGTGVSASFSALTTGTGMSISSSSTGQTTSSLLSVVQSGVTTGYTGNVVSITGSSTTGAANVLALTGANTTAGAVLSITANTVTTTNGRGLNLTANGLSSGIAANITSSSTALTSGSLLNVAQTGVTTGQTGATVAISTTATTGTGASALSVTANALNGQGNGLLVSSSTTGALTNGLARINASAAHTGTAFQVISAATTGSAMSIATNSLTTGTALDISSTAAAGLTSGKLLTLSKTGGTSAAFTGDIANLAYSSTYTTNSLTHSGNVLDLSRAITISTAITNTVSGALLTISDSQTTNTNGSATITYSGDTVSITRAATRTTGTLTNSGNLMTLTSSDASHTGNTLSIADSATHASGGSSLLITASSITSGSALSIVGPSSGITGNLVSIATNVNTGSAMNLTPTFSGSAVTGYGLNVTGNESTNTGNAVILYNAYIRATGNAAKTIYGIQTDIGTTSTTADFIYGGRFTPLTTGAISSGIKQAIGAYGAPAGSGTNTGGTAQMYGFYANPSFSAAGDTSAAQTELYGIYTTSSMALTTNGNGHQYGVYVADGTSTTTGSTDKYGIYVAPQTGADANYGAYFGSSVGIGTTTPTKLFQVHSTNADSQVYVSSTAPSVRLGNNATYSSLTQEGVFALGTAAAQYLGGSGDLNIYTGGSGAGKVILGTAGSARVSIATNGDTTFSGSGGSCTITGAGACSSDARLKRNVSDFSSALDKIMSLRPVTYQMNPEFEDQSTHYGFIAQEIQPIFPELVSSITDPRVGTHFGLNYSGFVVPIVKSIQDLNHKVENALLTINPQGQANSLNLSKLTVSGDIDVAGLVKASDYSLNASEINRVGVLASLPVDQQNRASVSDTLNLLAQAANDQESRIADLQSKEASTAAALADAKVLGEQALTQTSSLQDSVASTSATIANLSSQIEELFASITGNSTPSEATPSDQLALTPPTVMFASDSATLDTLTVNSQATVSGQLTAYEGVFQNSLKSLGDTFLGKTNIAGDLTVDGTFSVTEGSKVNALPILYFQTSALAEAVDFFNGLVTITKDGAIAAKEIVTEQISVKADSSAGTVVLAAGQTEMPVLNELVEGDSIIILTSETPGAPALAVADKVENAGFVVKLGAPYTGDIKFSYLIVGQK